MRFPMGSWLGKYLRAKTSSTTVTKGAFSLSWGVKKRPRCSGIPHCLQIIRFDNVVDGPVHFVLVGGLGLAVEPEQLLVVTAHGKGAPGQRGRLHAWGRGQLVIKLAEG